MKLHLAVQELIDCTKPNPRREKEEKNFYDDAGCFSSTVNHAFRRIKAKGICSEEDYEFQARRGECQEEVTCFYNSLHLHFQFYLFTVFII